MRGDAMKLHIKTYGCQMNSYDSSRMATSLMALGYRLTDAPHDADMVLINSCHIREKAAEKIYSEVGRLRHHRDKSGKNMIIAVAGCVAQAEGMEMMRRAPAIDIIVGPQSYHHLPQMVMRLWRNQARQMDLSFPQESKFDVLPQQNHDGVTAFVTIQEGCDKFCTFCVVPYTRGAEYSRPVAEIETEVKHLVGQGAKEITLLGQNVNAYHGCDEWGDEIGLAALIERLHAVDGVRRIRYTTSHARDMDEALMVAHRDVSSLMPFVHVPLQSGSNRVLALMNRQHTIDDYRQMVKRLRKYCPNVALSSDFICAFPGEREEEHQETLAMIEEIGFAHGYGFCYSPRPGTPAATRDNDMIARDVADRRLQELLGALERSQRRFNESFCGRTVEVLFEKQGRHAGQINGRTPWMQMVSCEASHQLIGSVQWVCIDEIASHSLRGHIVS